MIPGMKLFPRLLSIGSLCALLACKVDADDFKRSMVLDKPWTPDVSAPSGDGAAETRLYQLLYAGEFGAEARAAGQRVRMMGWLRSLSLSDAELSSLAKLGLRVADESELDQRFRAEVAAREAEVLTPIYARIEAALARPDLDPSELDALAQELADARASVTGDADPRATHRSRIRSLIIGASAWMEDLTHEQRMAVGGCRFVLIEQAAPLTNPGSYAAMVGMIWDRGDFSALQTGEYVEADGALDLGGLWALEHLRAPPSGYMVRSAREAMLLLALMDPAFLPAIESTLAARGLPMPLPEGTHTSAPGETPTPK